METYVVKCDELGYLHFDVNNHDCFKFVTEFQYATPFTNKEDAVKMQQALKTSSLIKTSHSQQWLFYLCYNICGSSKVDLCDRDWETNLKQS